MNNSAFCKVFTPGRLCLLGEHTDWVALISKDNLKLQYEIEHSVNP